MQSETIRAHSIQLTIFFGRGGGNFDISVKVQFESRLLLGMLFTLSSSEFVSQVRELLYCFLVLNAVINISFCKQQDHNLLGLNIVYKFPFLCFVNKNNVIAELKIICSSRFVWVNKMICLTTGFIYLYANNLLYGCKTQFRDSLLLYIHDQLLVSKMNIKGEI